jgi:alpha-N-arabinofuranosidase
MLSCTQASSSSSGETTESIKSATPAAGITIDTSQIVRPIPRELFGTNIEWPPEMNLVFDTKSNAVDLVCQKLAQDMSVSLVRFPCGAFSDYYHWRQGVGPYKLRPAQPHVTDEGSGPSLFGTDELADFCSKIKAEPLITVNTITGTAAEAADWVRYCNEPDNAGRKANGHAKPFGVRYFEIGNEPYMDHEGVGKQSMLSKEVYTERYLKFARAMRAADPTIRLGAVGGLNFGRFGLVKDNGWNEYLLKQAGGEIDYLCVHNAYSPVMVLPGAQSAEDVYKAMLASPLAISRNLDDLQAQLLKYVPGKKISLAITEWAPLFHVAFSDKWVDHPKTLGSALYTASTLFAFMRHKNVEVANFFKLKDQVFMGAIGRDNVPKGSYYALKLCGKNSGKDLVFSRVLCPSYSSPVAGTVEAVAQVPYLDVVASCSQDKSRLLINVVNKSFTESFKTKIALNGFAPQLKVQRWVLTGANFDSNNGPDVPNIPWIPQLCLAKQAQASVNPQFYKGKPGELDIKADEIEVAGKDLSCDLSCTFAPLSLTVLELRALGK